MNPPPSPDERATRFLAGLHTAIRVDAVTIFDVDHNRLAQLLAAQFREVESGVATELSGINAAMDEAAFEGLRSRVARLEDVIRRAAAGDVDDLYAEGERLGKTP